MKFTALTLASLASFTFGALVAQQPLERRQMMNMMNMMGNMMGWVVVATTT
ncbi:hypothetical protein DSO57_1009031 [Entomophthora muscae]|uniref:Uncharacterized protein n=1 Tax=Entomophthora muscae TaxID=34485 RepID=A0ACC2UTX8_9FUNG|nr:hypothetical protein DSO57_1009031 [Entomophthora muscae]